MSSSARLGLRTRELLSARVTAPMRNLPLSISRACLAEPNVPQRRQASGKAARLAFDQANSRIQAQASPKTEMANKMQTGLKEISEGALSMVLPGTFVLPPLSQFPESLWDTVRFLTWCFANRGQEVLTNGILKFQSKPSFFKAARFKAKRSALIPTAKALHRAMAEAFATGDKSTINKICSRKLSNSLIASLDARPRGRRYGWELVEYTHKPWYPSVRSHRITPISRERFAPIIRQAVVAISSRQRRVQYDAMGRVVPGSEKVIDVVENVAIARMVDQRTWTQGEWRLIGTIKPTMMEDWIVEKEALKKMMQEQ